MRKETIKNLLAIVGAAFIVLISISILIGILSGGGKLSLGDKVGVIKVEGVIVDSTEINRQIKEFKDRDDIKAVVLRINSPGGGVGPSQEIHREIARLKNEKKVVASFGSVAASGGYYIASPADKIVANPGTITGSIGVIVEFMNFEGLFEKIGLKGSVIKSGKFKDTGSPLRDMTDEEKALLQNVIDDVHSQFVNAVAAGRSLDVAVVEQIADGRIFSGAGAKVVGLVDELGGLTDAIELGARLAGIDGEPTVVYSEKRKEGLMQHLFNEKATSALANLYSGFKVMYLASPFN